VTAAISSSEYASANEGIVLLPPDDPILMPSSTARVTFVPAGSFTLLAAPGTWMLVAGLVVGGLFAAPFAALLCRHLRARALLITVGLLITSLSAWNLYRALAG